MIHPALRLLHGLTRHQLSMREAMNTLHPYHGTESPRRPLTSFSSSSDEQQAAGCCRNPPEPERRTGAPWRIRLVCTLRPARIAGCEPAVLFNDNPAGRVSAESRVCAASLPSIRNEAVINPPSKPTKNIELYADVARCELKYIRHHPKRKSTFDSALT